jgi:4-alpha-glucanotransferase
MKRRAGILLHISSLPGNGPIGDFGPDAFRFIDFLKVAGQSYWQILPLNQLNGGTEYSPYTPLSAFAGNVLFISEEYLIEDHLVSKPSMKNKYKTGNKVNYAKAEKYKQQLIESAFTEFKKHQHNKLVDQYAKFCEHENHWLKDYALFMALRKHFNFKSWNKWPEAFRDRHDDALKTALQKHSLQIEKEKFGQFLFHLHWNRLKKYAHQQGIKIFGDVPIYVGYDSADVWSYPHNFLLKGNKEMAKVAGVPPDYFNEDGQLWNMPIYNWETLKQSGYRWWIDRIRRNLELFDLARLDHFRGFSAYWEVDATETTAINGHWVKGPAYGLFNTLKHEFSNMPFAAEDLGNIDEAVYELRDNYHLPGMRVLQFAFGDDWPHSIHLPHQYSKNSIVYTGTHDNNTTRGWYSSDLHKKARKNVKLYVANRLNKRNVHREFIRMAYSSVAKTTIIPIQDILGLGSKARMNFPSTASGNWIWRMNRRHLNNKQAKYLHKLTTAFGRGG